MNTTTPYHSLATTELAEIFLQKPRDNYPKALRDAAKQFFKPAGNPVSVEWKTSLDSYVSTPLYTTTTVRLGEFYMLIAPISYETKYEQQQRHRVSISSTTPKTTSTDTIDGKTANVVINPNTATHVKYLVCKRRTPFTSQDRYRLERLVLTYCLFHNLRMDRVDKLSDLQPAQLANELYRRATQDLLVSEQSRPVIIMRFGLAIQLNARAAALFVDSHSLEKTNGIREDIVEVAKAVINGHDTSSRHSSDMAKHFRDALKNLESQSYDCFASTTGELIRVHKSTWQSHDSLDSFPRAQQEPLPELIELGRMGDIASATINTSLSSPRGTHSSGEGQLESCMRDLCDLLQRSLPKHRWQTALLKTESVLYNFAQVYSQGIPSGKKSHSVTFLKGPVHAYSTMGSEKSVNISRQYATLVQGYSDSSLCKYVASVRLPFRLANIQMYAMDAKAVSGNVRSTPVQKDRQADIGTSAFPDGLHFRAGNKGSKCEVVAPVLSDLSASQGSSTRGNNKASCVAVLNIQTTWDGEPRFGVTLEILERFADQVCSMLQPIIVRVLSVEALARQRRCWNAVQEAIRKLRPVYNQSEVELGDSLAQRVEASLTDLLTIMFPRDRDANRLAELYIPSGANLDRFVAYDKRGLEDSVTSISQTNCRKTETFSSVVDACHSLEHTVLYMPATCTRDDMDEYVRLSFKHKGTGTNISCNVFRMVAPGGRFGEGNRVSEIALPIQFHGCYGVLNIEIARPDAFGDPEIAALLTFRDQLQMHLVQEATLRGLATVAGDHAHVDNRRLHSIRERCREQLIRETLTWAIGKNSLLSGFFKRGLTRLQSVKDLDVIGSISDEYWSTLCPKSFRVTVKVESLDNVGVVIPMSANLQSSVGAILTNMVKNAVLAEVGPDPVVDAGVRCTMEQGVAKIWVRACQNSLTEDGYMQVLNDHYTTQPQIVATGGQKVRPKIGIPFIWEMVSYLTGTPRPTLKCERDMDGRYWLTFELVKAKWTYLVSEQFDLVECRKARIVAINDTLPSESLRTLQQNKHLLPLVRLYASAEQSSELEELGFRRVKNIQQSEEDLAAWLEATKGEGPSICVLSLTNDWVAAGAYLGGPDGLTSGDYCFYASNDSKRLNLNPYEEKFGLGHSNMNPTLYPDFARCKLRVGLVDDRCPEARKDYWAKRHVYFCREDTFVKNQQSGTCSFDDVIDVLVVHQSTFAAVDQSHVFEVYKNVKLIFLTSHLPTEDRNEHKLPILSWEDLFGALEKDKNKLDIGRVFIP